MDNPLKLRDVKGMAIPALSASAGIIAAKAVPSMVGLTGWTRTGAQVALGLGTLAVARKSETAVFFALGILGIAATEIIGRYLPLGLSGLGAEPEYYVTGEAEEEYQEEPEETIDAQMSALSAGYPDTVDSLHAFPFEASPLM